MEQQQPQVVMIAFPMQGRMIPLMTLASQLASHGASVEFLVPDSRVSKLQEAKSRGFHSGIKLVALHLSDELSSEQPDSLHDTRQDVITYFSKVELLAAKFEEYLNSLEHRPNCLIIDEICSEVSKVAKRSGLPTCVFAPQRALAVATNFYAPFLDTQGRIPIKADSEAVSIPGVTEPIHPSEFLTFFTDLIPSDLIKGFLDTAILSREATGLLLNTFEELEPEPLAALRDRTEINPSSLPVFSVGPLLAPVVAPPSGSNKDEERCIRFLDSQPARTVVFISFGSLFTFSEEQARSIATVLKASGTPFIWSLRDTQLTMELEEKQGLVLRGWAPQINILSHNSTGAFLSHCGWNSTIESLSYGVPVVCSPQRVDQHLNCKLIVDNLGVGARLQSLEDAAELQAALSLVLGSEDIRKKADNLSNSAMAAAAARDQLKHFIKIINS